MAFIVSEQYLSTLGIYSDGHTLVAAFYVLVMVPNSTPRLRKLQKVCFDQLLSFDRVKMMVQQVLQGTILDVFKYRNANCEVR